jgi:putative intracellular protease/amidase
MNGMVTTLKIAILLFDNYTALDVVGPYEVLSKIPNSKIYMVALKPGLYKDIKGLQMMAEYSLSDLPNPDILLIPGGFGIDSILTNPEIINWVQNAHKTTQWTVSVCSGALLLGAAGLLKDCNATTHWNRKEQLAKYGVIIQNERYVKDGKIITSAGVSAGIDMSLYLLSLITNENFAKAIQLGMEYDPQPPFDSGSPEKAPKEILDRVKQASSSTNKWLLKVIVTNPIKANYNRENIPFYYSITFPCLISCKNNEINTKPENKIKSTVEATKCDTLALLLNKSRIENKKLFLVFSFESCGWCRLFEKYHRDTIVRAILGKYFIVAKIDYYKTTGGKELYKRFGTVGFPYWSILDSTANVLVNSDSPQPGRPEVKVNIGYPDKKNELAYYINALKKAAPDIQSKECNILVKKLNEYRNKK